MLLTQVTLRRKVNSGAWTNVARAVYTYYAQWDPNGGESDLKTVTTQAWDGAQWQDTGTTLYRYYKQMASSSSSSSCSSAAPPSSSSSSSSSGASGGVDIPTVHLLKYVVNPASYARLKADPDVTDPLTTSDLLVSEYADFYFEYDDRRRVTREAVYGGTQTYSFSYAESLHSDGYNAWKYKTVETLPDGNQNVVYSNYAGKRHLRHSRVFMLRVGTRVRWPGPPEGDRLVRLPRAVLFCEYGSIHQKRSNRCSENGSPSHPIHWGQSRQSH